MTAPVEVEPVGSEPRRRRGATSFEIVVVLAVAAVMALVVKTFFLSAYFIPSESMEPGLVKDDRILVEKVSGWFGGSPDRGDVVVFTDPGGWLQGDLAGGHLVKRVVGVAGDTIVCCDDQGRLSINGEPLDEDYIEPQATCNGPMVGACDWTAGPVPEGTVFVMGDNRDDSLDSSVHLCIDGPASTCVPDAYVPVDLVDGRVFSVIWPLGRWAWVSGH